MRKGVSRQVGTVVLTFAIVATSMMPAAYAATDTQPEESGASLAVSTVASKLADRFTKIEEWTRDTFTEEVVDLTIEEAIQLAQTKGVMALSAEANKTADESKAAGYGQTLSTISEALDAFSNMNDYQQMAAEMSGTTESNEKLYKIQRDFARANIETNYQAEMNSIEDSTYKAYFGLLQAKENLKLSEENLALKNEELRVAQKKYEYGLIAKIALTQAESAADTAAADIETAQTACDEATRGLNLLIGYDVMQSVNPTSEAIMKNLPSVDLESAIKTASQSRNEIVSVNYSMELQEIMMHDIKLKYPTNSASYKQQYAAYVATQTALDSVPLQIETDIRTKATDLLSKADAIKSAQSSLSLAENAYEIAQATYKAGSSIEADVQSAELTVHRAEFGVTAAVIAYNTAALEYDIAQGVGTERINF